MDGIAFLFGLPLMAWFGLLAWLHLRHPERVWAVHMKKLKRDGVKLASDAPPRDFLATTRRRGGFYAALAVLTAASFGWLALDFHRIVRGR